MNMKYEHLLAPITVGKTTFRNRVFSAPMGLHALQHGEDYPTEAVITHYANKARGGAALVTATGVIVEREAKISDGNHAHYSPYTTGGHRGLRELADRIHYYGAVASMEIGHAFGSPYAVVAGLPRMMSQGKTEEMPKEEIERLAKAYGEGALALKELGWDMVMVHIGHGGTVGQFISPKLNTRTDEFGGSIENRCRFPNMIFDSIKKACGKDFLIELRFSGSEVDPNGYGIEDALDFIPYIEDHVDLLHVSCGLCNARYFTTTHPSGFLPPQPNVKYAEAIKASGTKLPVVTIGGIQDLEAAEKIIADGRADIVSIARGMIADPNLVAKAYEGRGEDVVPCIKCFHCHDGSCYYDHYVCSVNPTIGKEDKIDRLVLPAGKPKKLAVIGGGPAGMQAAMLAADRGHTVTLYEKKYTLGGQLNVADYAAFKYDLKNFKNYLIRQVYKRGIRLCLGTEATSELLKAEGFDWIIAATGAKPIVPPIPGIEQAVTATKVFGAEHALGKSVIIIGGGQVGVETGIHLTDYGKDVTIVEMREKVAPDSWFTYKWALDIELNERPNIHCITKAHCTGISPKGIVYEDAEGVSHTLEADSIVLAAGMTPMSKEAEALRIKGIRFAKVGDCLSVANVEGATRTAFSAIMNII